MSEKTDELNENDWLKDLPLNAKSEGYKAEEMIACQKCQRKNPPNRLECLYCGVELEFDENQTVKPIVRKMDSHVKGSNLIYLGNLKNWDETQIAEVAKMTRMTNDEVKKIFVNEKSLPIARVETEKEVLHISKAFEQLGLKTSVIEDETFELEKNPKRIRSIQTTAETFNLQDFNTNEIFEIRREDLILIVVGTVFERKLEATEKYQKKDENKIVSLAEISSDSVVIDLYTNNNLIGYRIIPSGFDFSWLADEKKLLAIENVKILINKLREFATFAKYDDDYWKVRDSLVNVWQNEETTDSKGLQRQNFGKFNRETVTTTSNLMQFTKYSRLQWLLLKSIQNDE